MGFFYHRKMNQKSSTNTTVEDLCDSICKKTIPYYCSPTCITVCPGTCEAHIPPPPPPPPSISGEKFRSHKASTFLTITIALLAASFLIAALYALYARYYNAARRRSNDAGAGYTSSPSSSPDRTFLDEEHGATVDHHVWFIRTVGLDPSIIGSITAVKYNKDAGLIDGADCSVCLSEFQEDETLRLLPKCSHAFHVACIDAWLRSHTNCPMCRAPVLAGPVKPSLPPNTSSRDSPAEEDITRVEIVTDSVDSSTITEPDRRVEPEPDRSSDSLDCLDDKATLDVVNKSRTNGEKKLRRLRSGGSSHNNSGHGSSMKRSNSCNGKFVLRRPVRLMDSILPLRSI